MRILSDEEMQSMLDGLNDGKTVRQVAISFGFRVYDCPEIREQLQEKYGDDRMAVVYDKSRPPTMKVVTGFIKKAAKVASNPSEIFADGDEQKRRLDLCNECEKQQDDRCTFCDCPCVNLVQFRAGDCELGKW